MLREILENLKEGKENLKVGYDYEFKKDGMYWAGKVVKVINKDKVLVSLTTDLRKDWERNVSSKFPPTAIELPMIQVNT